MSLSIGRQTPLKLDRTAIVWLTLLMATVLTGFLGFDAHAYRAAIGVLLLCVAFFKVRLVVIHFMEVRTAPLTLRILAEAHMCVLLGILLTIYLVGG